MSRLDMNWNSCSSDLCKGDYTTMTTATMTRNLNGLSRQEIGRFTPSVLAVQKHDSRSQRYTYIPTWQLLQVLEKETGYIPTVAMQSGSRIEGKAEFTKHLLRLRHRDNLGFNQADVHEILITNSHDGTSGYVLQDGVFRLVCTNGLVRGDINHTHKVYHRGGDTIIQEVVESTLLLAKGAEEIMDTVKEMRANALDRNEQLLLAQWGMRTRFDLDRGTKAESNVVEGSIVQPVEATKPVIYQPQDFLRTRRREDYDSDIYTTMNKVQENLLKGHIRRATYNEQGYREIHTTREVKGIDQNLRVNKALWEVAEVLLAYKQGNLEAMMQMIQQQG